MQRIRLLIQKFFTPITIIFRVVNFDVFVKSRHSRLPGIFPCSNVLIKNPENIRDGQAGMT